MTPDSGALHESYKGWFVEVEKQITIECQRCKKPFTIAPPSGPLPPAYDARVETICEECLEILDSHVEKAQSYLDNLYTKKDRNDGTKLPPEVSSS